MLTGRSNKQLVEEQEQNQYKNPFYSESTKNAKDLASYSQLQIDITYIWHISDVTSTSKQLAKSKWKKKVKGKAKQTE